MTTFERHRECGQPADLHVLGEDAAGVILEITSQVDRSARTPGTWRELARHLSITMRGETVTVDECPFSGDVEVTAHGQMGPSVRLTWKCPTCGHDHEEDGE